MTEPDAIPAWAINRAVELLTVEYGALVTSHCTRVDAFARYIAQHETPPVDPLVEALDAAYAKNVGRHGDNWRERFAEALRAELAARGLELAAKP